MKDFSELYNSPSDHNSLKHVAQIFTNISPNQLDWISTTIPFKEATKQYCNYLWANHTMTA